MSSYLSFEKLRVLVTKPVANRGIERYRRVGITASSSFFAKALNILIGLLSVPLTVHYLGAERYITQSSWTERGHRAGGWMPGHATVISMVGDAQYFGTGEVTP